MFWKLQQPLTTVRFLSFVLMSLLTLCFSLSAGAAGFVPGFPIVGDVSNPYSVSADHLEATETIERRNRVYAALPLATIVSEAMPVAESYSVLLIADDLVAMVDGSSLETSYLAFSASEEYSYGWEAVHLRHPASANVKKLQRLVIVADTHPHGPGIHTISTERHVHSTSIGRLFLEGWQQNYRLEGAASATRNGREYVSTIYTPLRVLDPKALWGDQYSPDGHVLRIWGRYGENIDFDDGFFTLTDTTVEYRNREGQVKIGDVVGTMVDPPTRSITDVYHDSVAFLTAGQPVLVVILDGLGYHQYEHALTEGYLPFLAEQPQPERASSVFQPVTNAGISAILTGETPDVNGVYSRRQRTLNVPDIFNAAEHLGRSALYLAGDRQIIAASLEQRFHFDQTGSGSSDDDIVASALEHITGLETADLVVLHIKDIDRAGHSYGDLAEETLIKISEMDEYLRQLREAWSGTIVMTADHGMHSTSDGGDHGMFCVEDMIVPYWILEGADQ